MTFAAPEHFWWLLSLPLLWWLSLPPKPRRQQWTPHFAQWQSALQALRRRPPHGSWLRFLLLAVAAACAIAAAAQPLLPAAAGPRRLVALLDASASTAARTAGGDSAFAAVCAEFERRVAALPPHVELTVLRCGGPLLRRHGASARSLHDVGAPSGTLDVDLVRLARDVANDETAVWTLTDGQGQQLLPDVGALTVRPATGANAAIVAVRVHDAWPLPELTLDVDVVAFASGAAAGPLVLRAGGPITAPVEQHLSLRPGEPTTVQLALERTATGGELRLDVQLDGDVLPADDACTLQLPALPAPRIGWLAEAETGADVFARVAAEALAAEVGGQVVAAAAGDAVGLLLVDGGVAPLLPGQVRALTFGSRRDGAVEPEPWLAPAAIDWDRRSPLTQGLDLSELRIDRAWRSVLPDGEPFLWADDGDERVPLAVVVDGEVASVHFAFRLQDSNLPLLPALPQLLRRAFVRSYGALAAIRIAPPPPPGEQDLRRAADGADRPLPRFGGEPKQLARWCIVAGLCSLALRAFVR